MMAFAGNCVIVFLLWELSNSCCGLDVLPAGNRVSLPRGRRLDMWNSIGA